MLARFKIVRTVQNRNLTLCIKSFKKYTDAVIPLSAFYPEEEILRFPEAKIDEQGIVHQEGSLIYNSEILGDE